MSLKRYKAVYTVQYECTVEVEEGEDVGDALSNIDIPEGGRNGSVYCEDSFDIIDTHEVGSAG